MENKGENMTTVGKFLILNLIIYFVAYVIIHIMIGVFKQINNKELKNKPGNIELENKEKFYKFFFNWFPAIYLIFIIIMFYVS